MKKKIIFWTVLIMLPAGQAAAGFKSLEKAAKTISGDILKSTDAAGASIAILPFNTFQGEATELGRLVADEVTNRIVKSGRFITVDRDYVARMLGEIKLGLTGLVDAGTASQLGKMSGARFLLVGTLKPYGSKNLIIQARLLETERAVLVGASRAKVKLDKEMRELYSRKAALDSVVGGLLPETKVSDDTVFLNQVGKHGCRWVEAHARTPIGKDKMTARAEAISIARRKAVRRLLGKSPYKLPNFTEEAFQGRLEGVLRSARNGRIEEEKIVEEKASGKDYHVVLQTCLNVTGEGGDKEFEVELMLNQNRFIEGQEARAMIVSSRDAYVYLYSVDFDHNAIRVFPVPGAANNRIAAGKHFAFPDEGHRESGVRLTARLPPGDDSSIEMLRVIALKRDIGTELDNIRTYPEIIRRLEDSGNEWAENIRIFTIYKR